MSSLLFPGLRAAHGHRRGVVTVWLAEPRAMVTRIDDGARVTPEMLDVVVGPATRLLLERLAAAGPGAKARFVHDWRGITGYEPSTRQALIAWGLELGRSTVDRIDILLAPTASAIVKMGSAAGEAVFSAAGITFRVHYVEKAFRAACHPEGLCSFPFSVPAPSIRPG